MSCGHRKGHHGGGCGCGCGGPGHFPRRFWTRKEKIARLEQYLADLQAEANAVEEHLAKMKAEE